MVRSNYMMTSPSDDEEEEQDGGDGDEDMGGLVLSQHQHVAMDATSTHLMLSSAAGAGLYSAASIMTPQPYSSSTHGPMAMQFHPDSAVQYVAGYPEHYLQQGGGGGGISYQILSANDPAAAALNLSSAVPLFSTRTTAATDLSVDNSAMGSVAPSVVDSDATATISYHVQQPHTPGQQPVPPALPPLAPLSPPSPPPHSPTC